MTLKYSKFSNASAIKSLLLVNDSNGVSYDSIALWNFSVFLRLSRAFLTNLLISFSLNSLNLLLTSNAIFSFLFKFLGECFLGEGLGELLGECFLGEYLGDFLLCFLFLKFSKLVSYANIDGSTFIYFSFFIAANLLLTSASIDSFSFSSFSFNCFAISFSISAFSSTFLGSSIFLGTITVGLIDISSYNLRVNTFIFLITNGLEILIYLPRLLIGITYSSDNELNLCSNVLSVRLL